MNWDAIGAVGEIIGAVAVVLTLIYLTIQVRIGINSVQGATELEASKQFSDWHARVTHSSLLRGAWDKGATGEDFENDEERTAYLWLIAELFFLFEGFYRQYKRGLMSEGSWAPLKSTLIGTLRNEHVNAWWVERSSPITDEFREYIEEERKKDTDYVLAAAREIGKGANPQQVEDSI